MTVWPDMVLSPGRIDNFTLKESCYVPEIGINIPSGFTTDLSSIPRPLRWLISPSGKTKRASVVHDFMIRSGAYSLRYSDRIFLILLLKDHVSVLQAVTIYWFLRAVQWAR